MEDYDNGQFLLCVYARQWLEFVEQKTDVPVNYQQSQVVYERVQGKAKKPADERQIALDIPRTYPEEPFF